MRVWTDGTTHVVLGAEGVVRHRDGEAKWFPADPAADGFEREVLAVAPSARTAWMTLRGSVTLVWLDGSKLSTSTAALAVVPLDDERVLAVVGRGEGTHRERALAFRTLESIHAHRRARPEWDALAHYLALPEPVRVQWPDAGHPGGVWTAAPWSSERRVSRHWEMDRNAWGAAAIDQETGIVVVVRPGAEQPEFALRVPVEYPETGMHAAATEHGVVVTHGGGRSTGGLNHFAADGRHLGGVALQGPTNPLAVSGNGVWVATEAPDYSSRLVVQRLDVATLAIQESIETELLATNGYPALHASADGGVVIVGDGRGVRVARREPERGWSTSALEFAIGRARATGEATPDATLRESPTAPRAPRRVRHKSFGEGVVLGESGAGESRKLEIEFGTVGRKTLLASFVEDLDER